MEWTEDKILKFINLYREREILWNSKHPSHYNKQVKQRAWCDIAAELGTTIDECKRKIVSLLSSLRRERARIRKSRLAAGGEKSHVYKSSWFAYKSFLFLVKQRDKFKDANLAIKEDGDSNSAIQDNEIDYEAAAETTPNSSRKRKKTAEVEKPVEKRSTDNEVGVQTPATRDDECHTYGMFIAEKLKSYSAYTRSAVQHAISDVLFKADRNYYERSYNSRHSFSNMEEPTYTTIPSFSPDPPELIPIETVTIPSPMSNQITKAEIEYNGLQ